MSAPGTQGYGEAAEALSARYDAVDVARLYEGAWPHFPAAPAPVLDIGAGSGRDAATFADRGHPVTAVEPCGPLRARARQNHPHPAITWVDASLPDLEGVADGPFDLILLAAVWMHLSTEERAAAMPQVARRLAPGGILHLSLRHGPIPPGRRMFPVSPEETLELAAACGLAHIHGWERTPQQRGNQKAGVRFTALLFQRPTR